MSFGTLFHSERENPINTQPTPERAGAAPAGEEETSEEEAKRLAMQSEQAAEVALLERIRSGNHEAFVGVVQQYQQRLYNYLYRFAHNRDDCEDLVSDTLFQAFSQLHTCRDLRKFRAWLFRIAHNLGINFWRKKARERNVTIRLEHLAHEIASWAVSQEEESLSREDGLLVEKALRELPAHYRSALLLYYYEDFSYKEMTEVLNIPLSLVKTHLFRGRKMLEAKLMNYFSNSQKVKTTPVSVVLKHAGSLSKTSTLSTRT
ncbi:MAG: RNA polymerase sigma factor [bacterium]|nr:RNA polymerase sigma factor [bacterium]